MRNAGHSQFSHPSHPGHQIHPLPVSEIAPPPAAPHIEPVTCPFVVIIDSREQAPFSFAGFRADSVHRRRIPSATGRPEFIIPGLYIPTEPGSLKTGDYSIQGMESEITVERKSLSDLYGTLSSGRDRFVRELDRMASMKIADIVIECGFEAAMRNPPKHTKFTAKSVFRTVNAWKQEYRNVHWNWCDSRALAEHVTFRILERYWKKRVEA